MPGAIVPRTDDAFTIRVEIPCVPPMLDLEAVDRRRVDRARRGGKSC